MPTTRTLTVKQLGVGTVRYRGENYPRFPTPVAEMLTEGGEWTLVKRLGAFSLCWPQNGSLPQVRASVPSVDELLKLGDDLYRRGEIYSGGEMWSWPVSFTPATPGRIASPTRRVMDLPARMECGRAGAWRAVIEWHDDQPVLWIERRFVRKHP